MDPIDHPVSRYATDVLEGKVVAGDLVRMACERHLLDLETGKDRGLYFDCQAASMVINFAPVLQHVAGPLAGKPLTLQPWQDFRHGSIFGWKREGGLRRFKYTYHQVGKKNGKTTDTAVPMLFTQLFDGEDSPEAYCTATTRDQANLLFRGVKKVIRRSTVLSQLITPWQNHIETPRTDGLIRTLSRDGNSSDGINPHFLARDEMHRWTDRELAETLTESMIARAQPIDWVITTAGHDRASLCGETRTYAEKVLRGDVKDDRFFAYVAEPPVDADPLDPRAWAMGNPNLGISKPLEEMRAAAQKATDISASMPNFRRFHLDLWTEGAEAWISRDSWDRGLASAPIPLEMLKGRRAWIGLDLSNKVDTTAIVVAVPIEDVIYLLAYVFLPGGDKGFMARAQSERREYIGWRDDGWLEVHDQGAIDEAQLVKRLEWLRAFFDVQEVAYDPWGSRELVKELDRRRFPLLEHQQGYKSMSEPMKRVEEMVAMGRLRHGGNPVLAWQIGNVHRDEDSRGNIAPNKKRAAGRIDAAVATIMAVGRAIAGESKRKVGREVETV